MLSYLLSGLQTPRLTSNLHVAECWLCHALMSRLHVGSCALACMPLTSG